MATGGLIGDEAVGAVGAKTAEPPAGGIKLPGARGALTSPIRLGALIDHQHGEPARVGSKHLEVAPSPHFVLEERPVPRSPIGQEVAELAGVAKRDGEAVPDAGIVGPRRVSYEHHGLSGEA
jgi:hypothetical protein